MLTFKGLTKTVQVTSTGGEPVFGKSESKGDITWIDFPGRGDFLVTLPANHTANALTFHNVHNRHRCPRLSASLPGIVAQVLMPNGATPRRE
jgi:hypothetical protein